MQVDVDWQQKRQTLQDAARVGSAKDVLRHVQELLAFGKATDVSFSANLFRKLRGALVEEGHRRLKTHIVRSVTVEPMLPSLEVEAVLHGYVLDIQIGGYGSYMDDLLNPDSELGRSSAELVLVLLDLEDIAGQLPGVCARGDAEEVARELAISVGRVGEMLKEYRSRSTARLVLSGCVLPDVTSLGPVGDANTPSSLVNTVKSLNTELAGLCAAISDCVFYDVDAVAARHGRDKWRDVRMFLSSRLPISTGAFTPFTRGLMRTASALFRAPKKVLCTDLDNTLWGGILGEDGVNGIATGSTFPGNCYLAYQTYLRELAARGILLAITSKNNESDVVEAFRLRASDLAVTLDDFVAQKIGWNDKADALKELAQELSLGLDSFVFIDDNPVECEAIRHHLPEVAVVQVPVNEPWRWPTLLADEWFFDTVTVTKDDRSRTQEYKAQTQREVLSKSSSSREDFLQSLGITCTFLSAEDAPLERAVQLLAKTNQFNLTTRRYSAAEVLQFVSDPLCQAVAVRVKDRFGDAGVVGLALTRQQDECCWVDSFLLSCRVIGRGIESALLARIADHAAETGAKWIIGEYIATKKNQPCEAFYADHGFTRDPELSTGGSVIYRLNIAGSRPAYPSWLTLEGQKLDERSISTPATA